MDLRSQVFKLNKKVNTHLKHMFLKTYNCCFNDSVLTVVKILVTQWTVTYMFHKRAVESEKEGLQKNK